ncbi:DNA ligase 4 [Elsinoe australis]|uniref:DNA ligase 4 n=1 Tax=Elsinoe australis TaxID=40998 RepID=A0A2P7YL96_9PEZI|nr:DNA ligase 4 [Elsinoe australis]
MAFKFSVFCHLLSSIEDLVRRDPPLLPADRNERVSKEIRAWFRAHRRAIDSLDVTGTAALLSSLLPERRTDRVYGIQQTSFSSTLCRALGLSSSKSRDLNAFKQPGHGDLGDCLERVLEGGGPPALPVVTLEEIDRTLLGIASGYRFSSPAIRGQHIPDLDAQSVLITIVRRLQPTEAKWLVRLVLKDLSPVQLDEHMILKSIHFLLPDILRFQHHFDAAVETLRGSFRKYPSCPDAQSASLLRKLVSGSYRPQIGIKISRSTFTKARSIDHCLQITNKKRWMIERKYDGEYCEMHVDLSRGQDWLKIYSKSGKDSTQDRQALREILRKSLAIDSVNCKIKTKCILLGELVVYSEFEKQIMPFHKIRKYVSRSGSYLGTSKDSPRHAHEHLMIVFFDLLLLDDNNVMQKPLEERKLLLQGLVRKKAGRATIAESKVLDFADPDSKRRLMNHLAASVAARYEGLVLKPCGRPYLAIPGESGTDASTVIKLKKDYISGLGDEADLAVVGASYDVQLAASKTLGPKSYTHFHVGCLMNQDDVERYQARPRFKVVGIISADGCIPPTILPKANSLARINAEEYNPSHPPSSFDLEPEAPRMTVVLCSPFVFEVLGSSYEKPSDCNYWMLRHPRVKKLHEDRTWRDCVSFEDLQKLAKQALSAPVDSESQENLRWMDKIERSCRRKLARASNQTTPTSPLKRKTPPTTLTKTSKKPALLETSHNPRLPPISPSTNSQALIKGKMDDETPMIFNVPVGTRPLLGQCAFLSAATDGAHRRCPLSNSVVCVPAPGGEATAKELAKLHGAVVVSSLETLVAMAGPLMRGVLHLATGEGKEGREARAKAAFVVGMELGRKPGVVVDLVDVGKMVEECGGVQGSVVDWQLAKGYEEARVGWARQREGSEITEVVWKWGEAGAGEDNGPAPSQMAAIAAKTMAGAKAAEASAGTVAESVDEEMGDEQTEG